MNLNKIFPFITFMGIVCLLYVLHKLIFNHLGVNEMSFYYSLELLYVYFVCLSMVILLILIKVKKKSFDNVGMSFLLATSVKMLLCYWMVRPLLQLPNGGNTTERFNFFIMFMVFLGLETLFTIRLVNEK